MVTGQEMTDTMLHQCIAFGWGLLAVSGVFLLEHVIGWILERYDSDSLT